MDRVGGKVDGLGWVAFQIEKFEGRTLDVGADAALAVRRVLAFLKLRLPGRGGPEVGGKGIGQGCGEVPDQLVAAVTDGAHRVIHLDLMEGVGGQQFVPAFAVFLA